MIYDPIDMVLILFRVDRKHYKCDISIIVGPRNNGAKLIDITNDSVNIIRDGTDPINTALG